MADELANASMTMPAPEAAAPMGAPVENATPAEAGQNAGGDQGLTFKSQAEFDAAVDARLNAMKQDWLNEAYRTTQSMNDKHTQAVNAMMQRLQAAGIKADQVQAAKMVQAEQQAQAQQRSMNAQIDPGYQQFLDRFGASKNSRDQRLKDAYALESEFATQLMRDDPEYQKYFGDPKKDFGSGYMFQRAYEKALTEKKNRMSEQANQNGGQPANPAAIPSLSGNTARSNVISNTMPSDEILAMGAEEMRRNFKY